mgnify:CR=1 FL=1
MTDKPTPPTDHRPPQRAVTLRPAAITADDLTLLQDLDAVAHLKRTTRTQVAADIVQRTLGPKFASQVAAA